MNKMKEVVMIAIAGLVFIAMTNSVRADSITPQEFVNKIAQVPGKAHSFLQKEIVKTKEYQKASWEKSKIQFANLKKLFIKN
tara:strand:- start:27 stop:272 length:246 start_codon:yes stop_codon:yes gene_type:complete